MEAAFRTRLRPSSFLALGASAALLWFSLGMNRGLVLATHLLGWFWPFSPLVARRPAATALSDPLWQFTPWLDLAHRELMAGRLPLWNPHQNGGVPLLGNAQSALGSPLVWPALLLGVTQGWNCTLLLRLLVALGTAWAWLRAEGRSRPAAALGAAGFALSGGFIAWLEHPQTLTAAAVPLLLMLAARAARAPGNRTVAGLAGATFLVLAGGHPETALMAALLALSVTLAAAGPRGLTGSLAGAFLGAGLAAPLLLPFLEYFRESSARSGINRVLTVLPDGALVRFVLPQPGRFHPIESAASVSLALLVLVPFGIRRRRGLFWLAMTACAFLAAYDGPVARALASATPIRWTRTLLLVPLPLAWLGARGLDRLRARARQRGHGRKASLVAWAFVAACVAELLANARGVHDVNPPASFAPVTPMLRRLAADRDAYHVLPLHTFLPTNTATLYALDDLRGYDAVEPAGFVRERGAIGRFRSTSTQTDAIEPWDLRPGGRGLDEWSVKYLMLHPQFRFGAETLNARLGLDLETVYDGPDGRLLRNRRALPRARLEMPDGAASPVRIVSRHAGAWRFEVEAPHAGTFVLADPFFPGWRARVDGRAVEFAEKRVGSRMRLPLGPGRHEIALDYSPGSFRLGLIVAALSLVVLVSILWRPSIPEWSRSPFRRSPGA